MNSSTKIKIKAILKAYRLVRKDMNNQERLELLKRWKEDCIDYEEYEMAIFLRKERNRLIRRIRLNKIGKRKFSRVVQLRFEIFKRKIKRFFT